YRMETAVYFATQDTCNTHTFSFLKYIFIQELEHSSAFDLQDFTNIDFYRKVFLSLL
ncbi:hypothetical protein BCV72DRAFT_183222, partial [Rhizopus microsporus var. microsporus]